MTVNILQKIRETDFFKDLSDEACAAVAAEASTRHFAAGDAMMKKGDPADSFFVILEGTLKIVTTDAKGDEIIINKVGPGESIGELALVDELPRSAGVVALEPVEALEFTKQDLFDLLARQDVSLGILRGFSHRLRFSTTYIEKVIDWSQKTAEGNYSLLDQTQPLVTPAGSDEAKAAQLLSAFYSMVRKVKEREDDLKEKLERLTVEIDQERRKREFEEIAGTEFYAKLKEQAKALRQKRNSG